MQDKVLTPILRNTFSMSDFYQRADMLQRFLEHRFFEKGEGEKNIVESIREYYKGKDSEILVHVEAIVAWGEAVLTSFTSDTVYERMRSLKQSVQELPQLTIYVPVHFSPAQIEPIGVWCRAYLHSDIMLEVQVDPETVGGCAFAYKNTFHDFSLAYFAKKERQALTKLVHEYGA